ncbi:GDP-L-fucose synthase (plasmid) [Cupriavidus necator]|uniref:GDP-L-fucose synthase n=1 Tax=Cupriavidus necator TaxID=106590 RepID=A0A367P7P1_CUPNE|nr:GDP-L-fucose synthase [Cupriavidus necator]QQX89581.1 GDP-L-fucose synthase [Cupriavidus necator]RCJ03858.1 GDP-L-fucose synthase [Cupriavidus necator]
MDKQTRIYVTGHRGMVGSALVRQLRAAGYERLLTPARAELDLTDQAAVRRFFAQQPVDVVLLAAARVGGIVANASRPASFLYENLAIEINVIQAAFEAGVQRLVFFGSSCIYPRDCAQPIREDYLLGGPLEPTNEAYAIAKVAGLKLCEACNRQYGTRYLSVMPTNLYGPNDNYDLTNSHVLPALIRKAHTAVSERADTLTVWGTGMPRREFLHVDDLAAATLFLLQQDLDGGVFNVGTGTDIPIGELAAMVCRIAGFHGDLVFDTSKPDGTPRKLLDVSRLAGMGWRASIGLEAGITRTWHEFASARQGQASAVA